MAHTHSPHHLHTRKRIHAKKEKYPHPKWAIRVLDVMVYVMGVVGPIMTAPQAWRVWVDQNVNGLHPWTWCTYGISSTVWLIYGVAHREWPIVVSNILWVSFNWAVFIGILVMG